MVEGPEGLVGDREGRHFGGLRENFFQELAERSFSCLVMSILAEGSNLYVRVRVRVRVRFQSIDLAIGFSNQEWRIRKRWN